MPATTYREAVTLAELRVPAYNHLTPAAYTAHKRQFLACWAD